MPRGSASASTASTSSSASVPLIAPSTPPPPTGLRSPRQRSPATTSASTRTRGRSSCSAPSASTIPSSWSAPISSGTFSPGASRRRCSSDPGSRSPRGRASRGTSWTPSSSSSTGLSGSFSSRSSRIRPPRPTCGLAPPPASRSTDWYPPPSHGWSRSTGSIVRKPGLHCRNSDPRTQQTLTSLEQARRIAALAREKLAEDIVILDMRPECSFTDYFVIATGRNARQTAAIWDEVHTRLKQDERLLPQSVDGPREGAWIVADYLDVVLHVFTPDAREYYRLEDLWGDVPAVEVDAAAV